MIKTVEEAGLMGCCQDRDKVCEATNCMGWRWWTKEPYILDEGEVIGVDPGAEGYCGLADRPEGP